MRALYNNILEGIGDTPSIRLNRVTAGIPGTLYAKLEYMNPASSGKDRIAVHIVDGLERSGQLRPGGTLVAATAGNAGAGLAMVAAVRGYKVVLVLSDKQSEEKRAILRAYGARVVVCADVSPDDSRSIYKTAERIAHEIANAVYVNQHHNPGNPNTHYDSTGPELWEQFEGKLDVIIGGLSTGGTLSGVGHFLKEKNPAIRIIGVDPVGSLFFDYFHTGQLTQPHSYKLEGIGSDFLPSTLDFTYIDDVVRVNDRESFGMTRRLVREEGLFPGIASGAAAAGALKWMRLNATPETRAAVLLPDAGSRYLSKVFNDNWMRENGYLEPELGLGTVKELMDSRGRNRTIISVTPNQKVTEVIGVLKLHGVSQVPVMEDGKVMGIVTENRLLERALSGSRGDSAIREMVEANYCTVDEQTEITVLTELFKRAKVAIVLNHAGPSDIISRIDLIDYLARVTAGARG